MPHQDVTVHIAVDPPILQGSQGITATTGNFVYMPAALNVFPGDTITFTCSDRFVVVFKDGTPVGEVMVSGNTATTVDVFRDVAHDVLRMFGLTPGFKSAVLTVGLNTGVFHYAVAVFHGNQLFVDAECPHVSVN